MSSLTEPVPELCEACMQKRREWWARFRPPQLPEHEAVQVAIEKLRNMTPEAQFQTLVDAGIYNSDGTLAKAYAPTVFGLWHNGWCMFITSRNPDRLGYGHSGTEAQANAGRAQFVSEGALACEYIVVEFDSNREPEVKPGKPTQAQRDLLAFVGKHEALSMRAARRTIAAVFSRGWVCSNISDNGQEVPKRPLRLTAAGRAALLSARGNAT